ncbi:MAG: SRPBCC family protein [Actinomycetota bacterium]
MSYELTVVRLLAASPEEVWDAYTDPEQMKAWFTILDDPMIVEIEGEVRVGGELRVRWGFSPDQLFWENQTFSVLDRPGRIVSRSTGGDPSGGSLTTDVEITFAEKGGKTLMTVNQSGFPDEATRDFFATTAWIGFFDRIEAYLTRRALRT